MTALRRLAVALLLGVAFAAPSHAVVYPPSATPPGPTLLPLDSFPLSGPAVLPGVSFVDNYYFSLSLTSNIAVASARIDIPSISQITGFYTTLFSGATPIATGIETGFVAPLQRGNALALASLAPGSYHLEIGGTSAGSFGGSYTGALAVTPVPEPEVWAMMVVGFGLVAFRLRQRSRKADLQRFA